MVLLYNFYYKTRPLFLVLNFYILDKGVYNVLLNQYYNSLGILNTANKEIVGLIILLNLVGVPTSALSTHIKSRD